MTTEVVLLDPKFIRNLAEAVRAAACFGIPTVSYTGWRIDMEVERLPRELRGLYPEVELRHIAQPVPLGGARREVSPVCVELLPGAQLLPEFEHPENAMYVFGSEDGTVHPSVRRHCHHFVQIPSLYCTNVAAAVYLTLYDRTAKLGLPTKEN